MEVMERAVLAKQSMFLVRHMQAAGSADSQTLQAVAHTS
jgi:hypothetical protein